jgi:transcriptional regulator with GAF, ATPase, and Fis domain
MRAAAVVESEGSVGVSRDILRALSHCPWPAWVERCSDRGCGGGTILFANQALRERLANTPHERLWDVLTVERELCSASCAVDCASGVLLCPDGPRKVELHYQRLEPEGCAIGFLLERSATGDDRQTHGGVEKALSTALCEVEKLTRALELERRYLREELEAKVERAAVVGDSPQLRALLEQVASVARTDSTVLILGETGTGKELIAHMIHRSSARANRALVTINCAALPAPLVESELFGHERGAFTGALTRRQGRFEVADRGTLFLDEVGELPLEVQAKLLRVIQEQEFERVGSSSAVRVNVRVVAATNRDLAQEVAAGRFRADLYYRLAVFPLRLMPLRERRDDIPQLAEHFRARYSAKLRRPCQGFTPDAMAWLKAYPWPGNVRELESVIERALILLAGPHIDRALIEHVGVGPAPASAPQAVAAGKTVEQDELLTLEEMERRHIERVLRACVGRVEGEDGAARVLGLAPSTLRSRMQKLRIKRPEA